MKKILQIIGFLFLPLGVIFGQGRIVFQDGYMVEHGGTNANPVYVVINNSNANAIVPGNGWFISENEYNILQWDIGTSTGVYLVPFGYSNTQYLPLTLNINTPGVGTGNIKFSTYHAAALNTPNPSDVTNLIPFILPGSPSNADDSYNMADRFYIIDANTGYTTKPAAGNITFSYISGTGNSEVAAPNTLTESNLMAERFNSTTNTWNDWFGYGCTDAVVSNVGTVQTGPVSAADMYRSWSLRDNLTPLPLTMTSTNVLCGGGNNGSATVVVNGGVNPYTYSWLPSGGSSATASGLSAGAYTVSVTDSHGCLSTMSVAITEPSTLMANAAVTANASGCASNGSAISAPSGGISPYTYSWTSGSSTSVASSLSAGNYTVTVTDNTGCTGTASITITAPPAISANATVTANASGCAANGSAISAPSGGISPYTYSWTSGSSTAIASSLSAGNYTVTVTDNTGCTGTASITITAPPAISANATVTANASGCAANGSAISAPSGGTSPYTYSWTSGSSTAIASSLSAGNYTVTVTDNKGCTGTASITITAPPAVSANASVTANATGCAANGSAISAPSGGTSPYTYSWTSGSSTAVASSLSAGNYTVTVTDNKGCTGSASITITAPPAVSANASVTANATGCAANGSAISAPSGGTSPYTYSWTSGSSTAVASSLSAGNYTVTVTDNKGCTGSASITITAPPAVSANASVTANATGCAANGSAISAPSGGNSPYTYSWTSGSSTAVASSLSAGNYTVTVTDNKGCTGTASITITAPAAVTATATVLANSSSCASIGSASVTPGGGTSPYTYSWTGGSTTASETGLSAGTYTVTVTDNTGCAGTSTVTITAPAALLVTQGFKPNTNTGGICNGKAWAIVSGGTAAYTFLWSPGGATTDTITSECAGTYCCKVTDNNGCVDSACVVVTAIQEINNASSIKIYPDPNNGNFTVEGVVRGQVIGLYDYLGQELMSVKADKATVQFDISTRANGIYLIRIQNIDGSVVLQKKIVKTQ